MNNRILEKERAYELNDELVTLLEEEYQSNPTLDNTIHILFVYWYMVLENGYESLESRLKWLYHNTKEKYQDNPKYLFYTGWMMVIAFWYLGEEEAGDSLLLKAHQLAPANPLYKWACRDQLNLAQEGITNLANKVTSSHFDGLGYLIEDYFSSMLRHNIKE